MPLFFIREKGCKMGVMTIIQIVIFIVSNLPDMIRAVRQIIELIRKNRDKRTQKQWRLRLSQTISDFKRHQDPERLGREIKQMKQELEKTV